MKVILKGIGLQTEADLSFITSDNSIKYVTKLEQSAQLWLKQEEFSTMSDKIVYKMSG